MTPANMTPETLKTIRVGKCYICQRAFWWVFKPGLTISKKVCPTCNGKLFSTTPKQKDLPWTQLGKSWMDSAPISFERIISFDEQGKCSFCDYRNEQANVSGGVCRDCGNITAELQARRAAYDA